MTTTLESRRLVIAGASSLLGTELKSLLEESRFAASDLRLVDEESVAGLLTEAGGEPAVIQPVEEDSFHKAWIVFFAGSPAFTLRNLDLAQKSGARIVDLSGAIAGKANAQGWLPNRPVDLGGASAKDQVLYWIPSAAAEIIARLALALPAKETKSICATAMQPVSAAGKAGIEELESQTSKLLTFQPAGQAVFDSQIAFNLLDRFGAGSSQKIAAALEILRREVHAILGEYRPKPAIQLLHAPVFYGTTVTASAVIGEGATNQADLAAACKHAGFTVTTEQEAPSNLSVAGSTTAQIAPPLADLPGTNAWWFWAAADNIRLAAANAVKLAESWLA